MTIILASFKRLSSSGMFKSTKLNEDSTITFFEIFCERLLVKSCQIHLQTKKKFFALTYLLFNALSQKKKYIWRIKKSLHELNIDFFYGLLEKKKDHVSREKSAYHFDFLWWLWRPLFQERIPHLRQWRD